MRSLQQGIFCEKRICKGIGHQALLYKQGFREQKCFFQILGSVQVLSFYNGLQQYVQLAMDLITYRFVSFQSSSNATVFLTMAPDWGPIFHQNLLGIALSFITPTTDAAALTGLDTSSVFLCLHYIFHYSKLLRF